MVVNRYWWIIWRQKVFEKNIAKSSRATLELGRNTNSVQSFPLECKLHHAFTFPWAPEKYTKQVAYRLAVASLVLSFHAQNDKSPFLSLNVSESTTNNIHFCKLFYTYFLSIRNFTRHTGYAIIVVGPPHELWLLGRIVRCRLTKTVSFVSCHFSTFTFMMNFYSSNRVSCFVHKSVFRPNKV